MSHISIPSHRTVHDVLHCRHHSTSPMWSNVVEHRYPALPKVRNPSTSSRTAKNPQLRNILHNQHDQWPPHRQQQPTITPVRLSRNGRNPWAQIGSNSWALDPDRTSSSNVSVGATSRPQLLSISSPHGDYRATVTDPYLLPFMACRNCDLVPESLVKALESSADNSMSALPLHGVACGGTRSVASAVPSVGSPWLPTPLNSPWPILGRWRSPSTANVRRHLRLLQWASADGEPPIWRHVHRKARKRAPPSPPRALLPGPRVGQDAPCFFFFFAFLK